jgi:integrase
VKIGKEKGQYAANRVRSLISSMFNRANKMNLWEGKNPVLGVKKFKEKSRERFLGTEEVGSFLEALEQEVSPTRDFFYIALFTGVRKSNILSMRWEDINFEEALWTIPETKNGEALSVPLTDEVIHVLSARERNQESPYVFPGKGKTGHLIETKSVWNRVLQRAGIKDVRIHDLRRTFGSWQAIAGSSTTIIGKSLGHKNVQTTAIYARLNMDSVRNSAKRAVQEMTAAQSHGTDKNSSQKKLH